MVTPFSPTDWQLTFDGVSVSLYPSIGNWSLACRSHYWIKRGGKVQWAGQWSDEEVAAGRAHDRWLKDEYLRHRQDDGAGGIRRLVAAGFQALVLSGDHGRPVRSRLAIPSLTWWSAGPTG